MTEYRRNPTGIFFVFTGVLVNIIFYATLKASEEPIGTVNFRASVFNLFQILLLLSVIKIIKREPKKVPFNRSVYEKNLKLFYDAQSTIEQHQVTQLSKDEDEAFDQFLATRGLRYCRKCLVFKVSSLVLT